MLREAHSFSYVTATHLSDRAAILLLAAKFSVTFLLTSYNKNIRVRGK